MFFVDIVKPVVRGTAMRNILWYTPYFKQYLYELSIYLDDCLLRAYSGVMRQLKFMEWRVPEPFLKDMVNEIWKRELRNTKFPSSMGIQRVNDRLEFSIEGKDVRVRPLAHTTLYSIDPISRRLYEIVKKDTCEIVRFLWTLFFYITDNYFWETPSLQFQFRYLEQGDLYLEILKYLNLMQRADTATTMCSWNALEYDEHLVLLLLHPSRLNPYVNLKTTSTNIVLTKDILTFLAHISMQMSTKRVAVKELIDKESGH